MARRNPYTPTSDQWDRHELRVDVLAGQAERAVVVHVTWPAYGGPPRRVVVDRDDQGVCQRVVVRGVTRHCKDFGLR